MIDILKRISRPALIFLVVIAAVALFRAGPDPHRSPPRTAFLLMPTSAPTPSTAARRRGAILTACIRYRRPICLTATATNYSVSAVIGDRPAATICGAPNWNGRLD